MTLLFTDGFDAADMNQKWVSTAQSITNTTFPTGRYGGLCAYSKFDINKGVPAITTGVVGVAYLHGIQGTNCDLIRIYGDGGTTNHLTLRYQPGTGTVNILRGSTSIATVASAFLTTAWVYIEMKVTINSTTGNVTVRVNGAEIINFTGNTKNGGTNSTWDTVWLRYDGGNGGQSIDDVYILNTLGTQNNDFLGDVRVQTVVPTGAGSNTQLTPSVAPNWDCVNELPYSATDYVSGSTVGNKDTYATADIATSYTVLGVQVNAVAKKTDATVRSLKTTVRSGGTDYSDATATALSSTDTTVWGMRDANPSGSAAWTAAAVNAMEIGVEVA